MTKSNSLLTVKCQFSLCFKMYLWYENWWAGATLEIRPLFQIKTSIPLGLL